MRTVSPVTRLTRVVLMTQMTVAVLNIQFCQYPRLLASTKNYLSWTIFLVALVSLLVVCFNLMKIFRTGTIFFPQAPLWHHPLHQGALLTPDGAQTNTNVAASQTFTNKERRISSSPHLRETLNDYPKVDIVISHDNVNPAVGIRRLTKVGTTGCAQIFIHEFLRDRHIRVHLVSPLCEKRALIKGLPQLRLPCPISLDRYKVQSSAQSFARNLVIESGSSQRDSRNQISLAQTTLSSKFAMQDSREIGRYDPNYVAAFLV